MQRMWRNDEDTLSSWFDRSKSEEDRSIEFGLDPWLTVLLSLSAIDRTLVVFAENEEWTPSQSMAVSYRSIRFAYKKLTCRTVGHRVPSHTARSLPVYSPGKAQTQTLGSTQHAFQILLQLSQLTLQQEDLASRPFFFACASDLLDEPCSPLHGLSKAFNQIWTDHHHLIIRDPYSEL